MVGAGWCGLVAGISPHSHTTTSPPDQHRQCAFVAGMSGEHVVGGAVEFSLAAGMSLGHTLSSVRCACGVAWCLASNHTATPPPPLISTGSVVCGIFLHVTWPHLKQCQVLMWCGLVPGIQPHSHTTTTPHQHRQCVVWLCSACHLPP